MKWLIGSVVAIALVIMDGIFVIWVNGDPRPSAGTFTPVMVIVSVLNLCGFISLILILKHKGNPY